MPEKQRAMKGMALSIAVVMALTLVPGSPVREAAVTYADGVIKASPSAAPQGSLDLADNTVIAGWASDPDYSGPILIHIYVDGKIFDALFASLYRPDVGYHAFHYVHTPFGVGGHTVQVYAIGVDASGVPDGQNVQLTNSPRTASGNCSGLMGDAAGWCAGVPDYWRYRQTDSTMLFNPNIWVGIDNSYGGAITQLFSNDRSSNLLNEHGGAFAQLSLYGRDGSQASSVCNNWPNNLDLNPIQAIGSNCDWATTTNDVDFSGATSDQGWFTRLQDPYHFTRGGTINGPAAWIGMKYEQKVTVQSIYAKVVYTITNGTQIQSLDVPDQEIPAIHTGYGVDRFVYWADSPSGVVHSAAVGANMRIPLSGTEGWWSICDAGTKCVTVATFSPMTGNTSVLEASIQGMGNSGYATAIGRFALPYNVSKTITVFLFPYRYDATVAGVNVRSKIADLRVGRQ